MLIPILDTGHGGMIGGQYQTDGKRSPNWNQGIIYEGAFNRWICWAIMEALDQLKIPYYHISPELKDVSLRTRVSRANEIYRANPNTYVISIHSNAGGGTGFEGFTSVGETKSDKIAESFLENLAKNFPDIKLRADTLDGDLDKERGYYILKNTNCPAVLLELLFMDHKSDYKKLHDPKFRSACVISLVETIREFYEGE